MTDEELSGYLNLAEKTGKVPAFKVGSAWRFKKTETDAWIKRQSEDNTTEQRRK